MTALCIAAIGCGAEQESKSDKPLEGFPQSEFTRLMNECDFVDIIFYNSAVAMSQDQPGSIRSALMFMDPVKVEPMKDCKPMGRIAYLIKGDIVAEADFYCNDECQYMVFLVDNKPTYINALSTNGVNFFQNILSQIDKEVGQQ